METEILIQYILAIVLLLAIIIIFIVIVNYLDKKHSKILEKLYMMSPKDFIIPAIVFIGAGMFFLVFDGLKGISMISLGLAIMSLGFGVKSIQLARDSDEKLRIVENLNFHRIIGLIRDRRLTLREKHVKFLRIIDDKKLDMKKIKKDLFLHWNIYEFEIYFSFSIWKCLTYLQQIEKLKERLGRTEQLTTIKIVVHLYAELLYGRQFLRNYHRKNYLIALDYQGQINEMYRIISGFDVFEIDKEQIKLLKEFRYILSENITEIERIDNVAEKYQKKYTKSKANE